MAILEKETVFTDSIRPVPVSELEARLERFRTAMEKRYPGWEMVALNHKVAMYYFTGTMQEGVLIIRPQDAILWVRRSYDRACKESHFDDIRPMHSFREAAAFYGQSPRIMYLEKIVAFTFGKWTEVNLFACSIGAFFALHAYPDKPFKKCLLQSPIIDMPWLIRQMMLWFDVSEARLEQEKRVATPFETLDWDYYQYVLQHPINKWPFPTEILYAGKDNLQPVEVMNNFATRFGSGLTVSPNSEHPFMGPEDADIVGEWLTKAI